MSLADDRPAVAGLPDTLKISLYKAKRPSKLGFFAINVSD